MKNNLDILFVHPNASKQIYQELSSNLSAFEFPIWATELCGYIRKIGYASEVLDCEVNRWDYDESVREIEALNPKIVAVVVYGQQPSASTQNMVGAMEIMKRLDNLNIVKIYTGPHVSALPERTIKDDPKALVCKGEGPKTFAALLKVTDFSDYSQLDKVPGLWYKNQETGQIKGSPSAPLLNLENELPMLDISLLDWKKYRTANWHSWYNNNETSPFASFYSSKGCIYQCQFCMINSPFNDGDNKNNTFRHWSPTTIIKTLETFAKLGIRNLKIADEMFVLKRQHFLEVCKLIIDRKFDFNIWCYARIDTIKEEYLEILKKAGVNFVGLGIENASQKVRLEVTKGKFQETNIRNIVQRVANAGISSTGNFIFGLPSDTQDAMRETLAMALDLPIDYVNFYVSQCYPGSELHRIAMKERPHELAENNGVGWIGYSQHAYETYCLSTPNLKNHEILKFRDESFNNFFTNENYLNRMVKKFGPKFKNEMDRMLKIKLKRKLLGDIK